MPKPADRDRDAKNALLRRARLNSRECSSTWADDLFHGRDRDWCGRRTGHGSLKADCGHCGREVPPQDLVARLCTDCRTIAPPDRSGGTVADDRSVRRGITLQRVDVDYRGEYGPVPFVVTSEGDGSPTAAVLDAMADGEVVLSDDDLPTADDAALLAAVKAYEADGDLAAFQGSTGELAAAAVQRDRLARYHATRPIVV